jgi:hypothetical protein
MRSLRLAVTLAAATVVAGFCSTASAVSPRNPYRSFNLSGINYGSMIGGSGVGAITSGSRTYRPSRSRRR